MPRYGRGKFEAAPAYVEYMHEIVKDPVYVGMPNAVTDDRVNWQVSSGKGTSFNQFYDARWAWWASKADHLGLPGSGNENERFTVTARRIHPTGYRPCRLCGQRRNVGYFYLNENLTQRFIKETGNPLFTKLMSISDALVLLGDRAAHMLDDLFPERAPFFRDFGVNTVAFEKSNYLRSKWLSPGFMGNPPDRLDGFHDYCIYCRASNDPGRSKRNLRSYTHDRRAFEYWAEGDWALADALYNSAGPGVCVICGKQVDPVSPDHVGPLSCGFKQQPLFVPTCQSCNSAKNRRMREADVKRLLEYERSTGDSVASWHVRGLWDRNKDHVQSDADAADLSAAMRALQDVYLRCLFALMQAGRIRFLTTLLAPQYAFFKHSFEGLDTGWLTFEACITTPERTPLRASLARRSVRIALDELTAYMNKQPSERKLRPVFEPYIPQLIAEIVGAFNSIPMTELDQEWCNVQASGLDDPSRERAIGLLMAKPSPDPATDERVRELLETKLYDLGDSMDLFL